MTHIFSKLLVGVLAAFTCVAAPAMAAGSSDGSSSASTSVSAYDDAKAMVDKGNYAAALPELVNLTKADPRNADAWNLLGFTYRKLGQMDPLLVSGILGFQGTVEIVFALGKHWFQWCNPRYEMGRWRAVKKLGKKDRCPFGYHFGRSFG